MASIGQGGIAPARGIAAELLTLAERTNDRGLLLEAHHAMWASSFWLGELSAAEQHSERGLMLYDRQQHRSLAFQYGGHDAGTCCRWFSAWIHCLCGRPVQATATIEDAVVLAEQLAHPPTTAIALTWVCALHYFERKAQETAHIARRLIDLATERDLPPWRAAGIIFDGWTRAEAGEGRAGIAQIREGLVAAAATGTLIPLKPLYMLVLVDACWKLGQVDEGLLAVDETLDMIAELGARVWLSELHRLKGELILMRAPADHTEAEDAFREALAIARQQGALAWDLRAATSLGRLLGQRGRRDEARQILGDVYGRFTEGVDTVDLAEARALLAELA
jgi:predicted ATPase